MELIRLAFKNTLRHKLRTFLTIFGIAIAICAFGLIRTVIVAWYAGVEASAPNRLVVRNAVSLAFPLPVSYKETIRSIPGIEKVSFAHWFGGIYIDERHSQFGQFAIDASGAWFDIFPEVIIPPDQKAAFLRERNAAIVGAKVAERFRWKIGDTVRIRGTFFPGDWDFVIRGIYKGAQKSNDETWFVFHWQYIDERLRKTEPERAGYVGWYTVKIADPDMAGDIAKAIDQRFKNSLAETITETERAFLMGFVSMSDAILIALQIVSMVIIGVMLLVLANTMAMASRERISEYAVLKTLGFGARHILTIIIGESLIITLAGGILGMVLIYPAKDGFEKAMGDLMGAIFPAFEVTDATLILSMLIAISAGLTAAVLPAWRSATLRITDGLRRVG